MKILIYSHYFLPSVGGVERFVDGLARGFAEKGHSPCVVTATASGVFDDTKMPYRAVRRPSISALIGLIHRHDVIHLAGPALLPMLLAYLQRKPFIIEHHNYQSICPNGLLVFQPDRTVCPGHFMAGRHRDCLRCNAGQGRWRSFRMWLLASPRLWFCRRAAANVAIAEHVRQKLPLPRQRVIYHGVAATFAGPRAGASNQNSPAKFAYIGRFVTEKGLLVLIEAAARVKEAGLAFRLKLVGDGPELANVEAAVSARKLNDRVTFTGMLSPEGVRREIADVEALIVPSLWEELCPLAPIEQMMRGMALIVSDIGGAAEVVGDTALRFPPGNAQALAECMRRLIDDSDLARRLGASARKRALALFSRDAMMEAHLQLYQEVSTGASGNCGPTARAAQEAGK